MCSENLVTTKFYCFDTSERPVTIAGAGNPLISCDRIGSQVLSAINDRYGNDVELCETGTNGLALLDIIRHQDLLIVVDACLGSGPPGLVSLIDPSHIEHVSRGASVHQLGPVEALMIGSRLYPEMMPQRSLLITVDTNDLKEEDESVACEQVIRTIDREIQAWRLEKTQGA